MTTTYVLRELPGVVELEERLARIEADRNGEWSKEADGLQAAIDALSRRLFGITEADTEYNYLSDGLPPEESSRAHRRHEQNFSFLYEEGPEAEAAAALIWDAMGWDVTDGAGEELLVLDELGRQIIAATKGLCGRLPDEKGELTQKDLDAIEAKLRGESLKFRGKR